MSVSNTTSKVIYLGNNNTVFPYTFKILTSSDLIVEKYEIATDTTTTMVLNTDYSVSGVGSESGGNVTMVLAVTPAYKLVLRRVLPLTQEVDYVENDPFRAEVHEGAIDKLTMITQQLQEGVDRSVKWETGGDPLTFDDFTAARDAAIAAQVAAEAAQAAAELAETNAETAETNAETAQTAAELAETNAETAETNAETAETNAAASAAAAAASALAAQTAETNAETAETNAETAESNAAASASAAAASALAAQTAETNAETAETNAETAETNAETAETNAETAQAAAEAARDLAQNYAAALVGTSTTSVLIGTGTKTFTTQSGKQWVTGDFMLIASQAASANYMWGQVTSYSGTSLQVNVLNIGGVGTHADWNISIAGVPGPTGPAGSTGSGAITGVFTNSTLVAGKLTITHNLNLTAPYPINVLIFDNNAEQVVPDNVVGSANSVEVDLTSYGTITGNWGFSYGVISGPTIGGVIYGTFTNANLTTGHLIITHNLSLSAPYTLSVSIFNNSNKLIVPDDVLGATNSIDIDLSSYGTITGTWGYSYGIANGAIAGVIPISNGGTGQTTRQNAINALTDTAGATNEHVLTKDTATGNAIFKAASSGFQFPVGFVVTLGVSTNPATLFGYGTWTQITGRVIVGLDSGQTEFDTLNETGGSKTHTLVESEIPSHTHNVFPTLSGATPGFGSYIQGTTTYNSYGSSSVGATGGGGAHNNLQPYIVKYVWERTA